MIRREQDERQISNKYGHDPSVKRRRLLRRYYLSWLDRKKRKRKIIFEMRAYHRPRVDMLCDFFQHHQSTRAAIYLWIHARRRPNFIITCVWRVRDLPVDSLTLYQATHWNDFPGGDGIFVSRSILNSLAPLIVFFPFLSTVNVKALKTFDNQRSPPKKSCNLSTQTRRKLLLLLFL